MSVIPKLVSSWTISINGKGFLGKAESIDLPELKAITQDVQGAGMTIKNKVVVGYEPMTCKITFLEIDPELYTTFGLGDVVGIICKAALGNGKDSEPLTAIMHGRFHELSTETFKMGEVSKTTAVMDVKRYTLLRNEVPMTVIDTENNIVNLSGVDSLEQTRTILGV